MKRILLTMVISLASLGVANSQQSAPEITTASIGTSLPLSDVKMDNANGESSSLEALKGKNGIVLIFSCNTCPFVVGSESFAGWEKTYNNVEAEAKQLGFQVVLVNSNEAKRDGDDSFVKMQERAKAMSYAMPYLVDKDSQLANALGAKTTPHVFVFNTKNELVYTGMIDNSVDSKRNSDIAYLIIGLKELSSGQTITTTTTPPRGCSIKRKK